MVVLLGIVAFCVYSIHQQQSNNSITNLVSNELPVTYEVVFSLNQACSFSNARPRWEMWFFADLSISAYL